MQQSGNVFQRGFQWVQITTRKIIRGISGGDKEDETLNQILRFPNLKVDRQMAKNQGIRRVRDKMGFRDREQRPKIIQKKIGGFWQRRAKKNDDGMELSCPICMDYILGPVSTPCGHTFCWQCLDEAFILSTACPVCRLNIQKVQFVRCIELQMVILGFMRMMGWEQNYIKKLQTFQKWRSKRYITLGQVYPSDLIDVRDTEGIWCPAVIKDIVKMGDVRSLLVHYIGWNSLYDQVIELGSQRLASYRLYTGRAKLPRYQLIDQSQLQGYVMGLQELEIGANDSEQESQEESFEIMSEDSVDDEESHGQEYEEQHEKLYQSNEELQSSRPLQRYMKEE